MRRSDAPRSTAAGVSDGDHPGAFEQLILLALLRLGERAYGMTVRQEIEARTGRSVSLGAVYATLDRLEQKRFVRSHSAVAADAPERGGRARRFFRVEAAGEAALARALEALDRMREGVPSPTGRRAAGSRPTGRAREAGAGA
ncbi:MAG TPA: helix-turn-helix transcriptional regulator [Chloroflexota bacterium]|nr:helix-turn-helix transcriptional regulator [Chloroflexota bacterium]